MQPITVLSIAGSDSGGGAGLQADLRTFSAFGVHGTTAVTAVTAQNTLGVHGVTTIPPDAVEAQVRAVIEDFTVAATKTGMLAEPRIVERVAELARAGLLAHLVVDPVLVATSGDLLMDVGGVEAYRDALFPFAEIVTPNLKEAAVICGVDARDVVTVNDLVSLARDILNMGPRNVLVKGGHLCCADDVGSPDVLVSEDELVIFEAPRIATENDHGTGCSLSSAIAAGLGLGRGVHDATRDAKSFVLAALTSARTWHLGHGRGPIDHLGWGE